MIPEEGNRPYRRFPECDIFVSRKDLNSRHLMTDFCRRGEERKRRRLAEEEARSGKELEITDYGIPLALVTSFRYLPRFLSEAENDCPVVVHNLQRPWQKWYRLDQVLSREGEYAHTSGQIYLAVVQEVILYGSETRVMTLRIKRVLGEFHHRVSRKLTGRQPHRGWNGVWVFPLLKYAMA